MKHDQGNMREVANGRGEVEDIYLWEHGVAVEPWAEPVELAGLLDELEGLLARHVVLPRWAAGTLALWVVHTYGFQLRQVATYIGVESPEKRCGKTTLLTVLCELVNRPVVASNISSPAFFRVIEEKEPTLLIDEADTVLHRNQELRGILNSGYAKRTAYVIRMTPQGARGRVVSGGDGGWSLEDGSGGSVLGDRDERGTSHSGHGGGANGAGSRLSRFSCWCPKAIATIKHLPETLADRCIVIRMQRKAGREKCERLRNLEGRELRRKCARFVLDHREAIAEGQPAIPEELNDRAADIWEPLLVLADLAGGDWPEKARQAAVGLTASAQEESPIGALLLDLLILFVEQRAAGQVKVFTRDLVAGLNCRPDRPWSVLRRGKMVTDMWLSQQLRPYGIRPRTVWIGESSARGYLEEDFTEAFRRYIPRSALHALREEVGGNK
jgi:hypothetical protein